MAAVTDLAAHRRQLATRQASTRPLLDGSGDLAHAVADQPDRRVASTRPLLDGSGDRPTARPASSSRYGFNEAAARWQR